MAKQAGDAAKKGTKKFVKAKKQPTRLYCRGVILGPKRSKSNVYPNCTLVKIEGVKTRDDTEFYFGKRIAYIYKGKTEKQNSKFRVMWGKIRRAHGNSGVVRAKFRKNIPAKAFGGPCRIMLYPSSI
uniref:60S ribosomal protein L35a n=1 Tax=Alexandrium catenella TaxID=2925 RepID=A0A7S1RUN9_ALECA|mmetsp:Transcript_73655/g.195780  ORF Transcript_73655/g.195780 Transcript_73655/m.195780 type:complete len:127 (+) Transcript_73655:102-482(+)